MTKHLCSPLLVVVIFSGCVSYPSGMTELGTESQEWAYTGEATYIGWFGMNNKSKPEVYREALLDALKSAEVDELENVHVWTTDFRLGALVASVSSAVITALAYTTTMGEGAAVLLALAILALSGLEVQKITVTGTAPVVDLRGVMKPLDEPNNP